jgi:putative ubiquitin-RnfH superfamily antitoxin RatB of RatAB toxin-antitoxin module
VRVVIALLAALSLNCAAAPFTVRLGIERIVLDTPPGFSDTTDLASPRLQDLANTLTAASNRILIFALSDADVRNFTLGDQLEVRRYMIAVTPKELERERVSPAQFAQLVSDSLHDLGKPVVSTDIIKFLETQPIGKLHLIAELKKEPAAISVMQATRLPPLPGKMMWEGGKPQYIFSTTTLFLVRGKALHLAVYAMYDSPADIDWLKSITQRWIDELLRLNR